MFFFWIHNIHIAYHLKRSVNKIFIYRYMNTVEILIYQKLAFDQLRIILDVRRKGGGIKICLKCNLNEMHVMQ